MWVRGLVVGLGVGVEYGRYGELLKVLGREWYVRSR